MDEIGGGEVGETPARKGEPRRRGGTGPSRLRGALMGEMLVCLWLFGIVERDDG